MAAARRAESWGLHPAHTGQAALFSAWAEWDRLCLLFGIPGCCGSGEWGGLFCRAAPWCQQDIACANRFRSSTPFGVFCVLLLNSH